MLSCKKATGLIEKKTLFPVSLTSKIQLFFHTLFCDACKKYEKESFHIDNILNQHLKDVESSNEPLSTEFKQHIITQLEEEK